MMKNWMFVDNGGVGGRTCKHKDKQAHWLKQSDKRKNVILHTDGPWLPISLTQLALLTKFHLSSEKGKKINSHNRTSIGQINIGHTICQMVEWAVSLSTSLS